MKNSCIDCIVNTDNLLAFRDHLCDDFRDGESGVLLRTPRPPPPPPLKHRRDINCGNSHTRKAASDLAGVLHCDERHRHAISR